MISYNPLWKALIDRNIKRSKMAEDLRISPTIISRMGKNGNTSTETLEKICRYLDCRIEDVVEYVPDREIK